MQCRKTVEGKERKTSQSIICHFCWPLKPFSATLTEFYGFYTLCNEYPWTGLRQKTICNNNEVIRTSDEMHDNQHDKRKQINSYIPHFHINKGYKKGSKMLLHHNVNITPDDNLTSIKAQAMKFGILRMTHQAMILKHFPLLEIERDVCLKVNRK